MIQTRLRAIAITGRQGSIVNIGEPTDSKNQPPAACQFEADNTEHGLCIM